MTAREKCNVLTRLLWCRPAYVERSRGPGFDVASQPPPPCLVNCEMETGEIRKFLAKKETSACSSTHESIHKTNFPSDFASGLRNFAFLWFFFIICCLGKPFLVSEPSVYFFQTSRCFSARFLNYMGEFWLIGFFDEWMDPAASFLMPPLLPAQKAFHPFTNWLNSTPAPTQGKPYDFSCNGLQKKWRKKDPAVPIQEKLIACVVSPPENTPQKRRNVHARRFPKVPLWSFSCSSSTALLAYFMSCSSGIRSSSSSTCSSSRSSF